MPTSRDEFHQVYRPDSRADVTSLQAVALLAAEVWTYRDHIQTVFRQEFGRATYGSTLGALWNFVLPALPLTVYLVLARMQVFPGFPGVDPASYIAFGVTLWFLMSGALRSPIQTVALRNTDVMKTALPLSSSIVASFGRLVFDTLVRLAFVVAMFVLAGKLPHIATLYLPALLVPMLCMFFGIGLALAMLNVIANDIDRVVSIVLTYGILLSGVIFPVPPESLLGQVNRFNPFAVFIGAARDLVFAGTVSDPWAVLAMSLIGVAGFVVSCRVFYVMEYRVRGIV